MSPVMKVATAGSPRVWPKTSRSAAGSVTRYVVWPIDSPEMKMPSPLASTRRPSSGGSMVTAAGSNASRSSALVIRIHHGSSGSQPLAVLRRRLSKVMAGWPPQVSSAMPSGP